MVWVVVVRNDGGDIQAVNHLARGIRAVRDIQIDVLMVIHEREDSEGENGDVPEGFMGVWWE